MPNQDIASAKAALTGRARVCAGLQGILSATNRGAKIVPITSDVMHVCYGEHRASIAADDCALSEWLESLD